jgi:hypothetical protein
MAQSPLPAPTVLPWANALARSFADGVEYTLDALERSVLFWDTMRERGNVYLEHSMDGKPPLLRFGHELLVDGATLERPTNYSLLRVLPGAGDPPTDENARPIVVVDPRAGHGPGIGGFKPDSQVGVALRGAHPVYFVTFGPEPVPGQTLGDVAWAEAKFIETVVARHPGCPRKPAIIGNCQAGWAVAALASVRPELVGPLLLNGAPLSYWAGSVEQNPMRYSGGVLGGSWLASLASDLGAGQFDGSHLVQNFENLNPANTLWSKHYNLYANVDTEAPRYLEFERWWGGFFRMTTGEIESIVENLFVGNRLAAGEVDFVGQQMRVDLRNIESPVVVFASFGDNITPPAQALDWIADVWGDERAIVAAGRTIVYLLHDEIGHLGIFVGAAVARKEHDQMIDTLDQIDVLPPGLYEMVVEHRNPSQERDELSYGEWSVRFESRRIADLRRLERDGGREDEAIFSTISKASDWNAALYKTWFRPFVSRAVTPAQAEFSRAMSPGRLQRSLMSDANPFVKPLREWARAVRGDRHPVSPGNPFLRAERELSRAIVANLDAWREQRDRGIAHWVSAVYGPLGVGAVLPPDEPLEAQARARARETLDEARAEAEPLIREGGFPEALVRMLFAAIAEKGVLTRRSIRIAQLTGFLANRLIEEGKIDGVAPPVDWKRVRETQARVLALFPDRAIAALPELLPDERQRALATALVGRIMMMESPRGDVRSELASRAEALLGVDVAHAARAVVDDVPDDAEDPHFPPVSFADADEPYVEPRRAPAAGAAAKAAAGTTAAKAAGKAAAPRRTGRQAVAAARKVR